jgi:hypothetical protein
MALALLIRIAVEELVDATCTNGGCSNALATLASPRARFLARAESLDCTSDDSGLRCLCPLAFGLAFPRGVSAAWTGAVKWSSPSAATSRLGSDGTVSRTLIAALASESGSHSAESESAKDIFNARLLAVVLRASRGRSGVLWVIVAVVSPTWAVTATSSTIASSSAGGGRSGVVSVPVAVVVVVSVLATSNAACATWGSRVVVVFARSAVVAGSRRRELARDVFDAVVAASEDEVARAWTFAALDECLLAHKVRLVALTVASAGRVVAARLVVVVVGRHDDGVRSMPRWWASGGVDSGGLVLVLQREWGGAADEDEVQSGRWSESDR